ncbi:hypothetical protein MHBO_005061, partial [Bonamia ostreae]
SIAFYLLTSFFAALQGLAFMNIIKPGTHNIACTVTSQVHQIGPVQKLTFLDSMIKMLKLAIPANILLAITNDNILGVLVIFLTIGFFMAGYIDTEGGKQMKTLLDLIYQTIVDAVYLVIGFTPIGVFSLIAGQISQLSDLCILAKMGIYIAVF